MTTESKTEAQNEDQELLGAIQRSEDCVRQAESDLDQAKENVKYLNQVFQRSIADLRKLVRCGIEPSPLFDEPKDENEDPRLEMTVSKLDLPQIIFKLFGDAKIETISDIAAWTKGNKLTDIKGIGEAKAEEIEAALERFWKENDGS